MATAELLTPDNAERELGSRFEIVNDFVVELPHMGVAEALLASSLANRLGEHVRKLALGWVACEVLYWFSDDLPQRRPDVSFVPYSKWPKSKPIPPGAAWSVKPDLAVDVIGPSESMLEALDKMREYFAAGIARVWLILSDAGEIYVYTSPKDVHVLLRDDVLEANDIIPGFRLPLVELFSSETD